MRGRQGGTDLRFGQGQGLGEEAMQVEGVVGHAITRSISTVTKISMTNTLLISRAAIAKDSAILKLLNLKVW